MDRKRLGHFVAMVTSALFVLALASGASAQTGMLKGKVVDGKDAPVEGAKVTITAKGMKNTREVKTNKKGEFVQIGLFPGDYSVTAEKEGDSGTVSTRVSVGENPETMIRIGRAGPSAEATAKAAALQKSFARARADQRLAVLQPLTQARLDRHAHEAARFEVAKEVAAEQALRQRGLP